jgi:Flp pilus assembly protein CpaB
MLVGLLLVAVSVAASLTLWGASRETVPVVVVVHDLPSGHVLQRDDLGVVQAKLESGQAALVVAGANLDQIVGRTLATPVYAGELLVTPRLASGPVLGSDDAALTLAVRADSIYPRLRPGDEVAVLITRDKGKPASQTTTLLERATVYAVTADVSTTTFASSARGEDEDVSRRVSNVTLLVPKAQAEQLAHAAVNWDLTIALVSPAGKGP